MKTHARFPIVPERGPGSSPLVQYAAIATLPPNACHLAAKRSCICCHGLLGKLHLLIPLPTPGTHPPGPEQRQMRMSHLFVVSL